MDKYKGRCSKKTIRLKNWDYRNSAYYFITICVDRMRCKFGKVIDDKMMMSELGKLADEYLKEIHSKFDNVELDEFIVMPNHVHCILILHRENFNEESDIEIEKELFKERKCGKNPKWKSGVLGSVVNQYKRVCTLEIKKRDIDKSFKWKPRFYENIIRDERAYLNIKRYIINNPKNWDADKFS